MAITVTKKTKLIIAGIQNVGKSSILKVLDRDFVQLHSLKPTQGVERSTFNLLGMEFVRWDLGGQSHLRENHLARRDYIFSNVSMLVYVVDIQDDRWVDETLEYFDKIAAVLKEVETRPFVAVLFHKYDPDLRKDKALADRMQKYVDAFDAYKSDFDVDYYTTSIYDRPGLVNVFSYMLRKKIVHRDVLEEELRKIQEKTGAPVLYVTDSIPFVLGQVVDEDFAKNQARRRRFEDKLNYNLISLRSTARKSLPRYSVDLFDSEVSLMIVPFEVEGEMFYLAGLFDMTLFLDHEDAEEFNQFIETNARNLKKILELFYAHE